MTSFEIHKKSIKPKLNPVRSTPKKAGAAPANSPVAQTLSPAQFKPPLVITPVQHFRQSMSQVSIYDTTLNPPLMQGQIGVLAVSAHYLLAPLGSIQESMSNPKIRLLLKTYSGSTFEVFTKDFDLSSHLAIIYSPTELVDFVTASEMLTRDMARAVTSLPWQVLGVGRDPNVPGWTASPSQELSDEIWTYNTFVYTPSQTDNPQGALLMTRNFMISGFALGRIGKPGDGTQEIYAPTEDLQRMISKIQGLPSEQPDPTSRTLAVKAQFDWAQSKISSLLRLVTLSQAVRLPHWSLRERFPNAFHCRMESPLRTQCESNWPFQFSRKNPMLEAKLTLQEFDPSVLRGNSAVLDSHDSLMLEEVQNPLQYCRQNRLLLAGSWDSQVQTCVIDLAPFRKKTFFRGLVLKKEAPLYFELSLTGMTLEQSLFLSQNLYENLQWSENASP